MHLSNVRVTTAAQTAARDALAIAAGTGPYGLMCAALPDVGGRS